MTAKKLTNLLLHPKELGGDVLKYTICIFAFLLAAIPSQASRPTLPDPNSIQGLINDANDGDVIVLQPGTYTGPDNRDIEFLGKAVTLRSADPNDPATVAATIIDCNGLGRAFYFHTSEDANSVIDGLTIVNGFSDSYGGAIYCDQSGPTVKRCVFTNNSAYVGGAIYYAQSSATITECVFHHNSTTGYYAGAVGLRESSLTVLDCDFHHNLAWKYSAGLCGTHDSALILKNCTFVGNSVLDRDGSRGGGLGISGGTAALSNCLFAGNSALNGGALLTWASDISVANCTFSGNHATEGNALYFYWSDKVYGYEPSHVQIRDSIIWDGADSIVSGEPDDIADSTLLVTFSSIPGVWPGYENIDADPCFVDPGYWDPNGTPLDADDDFWVNGDYHLKSQAGHWDANSHSWVADNITSPCIDTADSNTPLGTEPFPNGGRINMGAYGGTIEASKSYFGKPLCETIVAGDINGDCVVNSLDFSLMAAHWLGQYRKTYPGLATDPYPPNGQENTPNNIVLTWVSGSNALSHDIYLGTDYTAVRNAQKSSPEYKGNQPATTFYAAELPEETPHYWRIDEVGPHGETTTGGIWHFTTGTNGTR